MLVIDASKVIASRSEIRVSQTRKGLPCDRPLSAKVIEDTAPAKSCDIRERRYGRGLGVCLNVVALATLDTAERPAVL